MRNILGHNCYLSLAVGLLTAIIPLLKCILFLSVRSLYITEFQAIVSIGIAYVVAPPTWDNLTHLALSGLVDSSNQVWREGTDLASVAREV